MSAERTSDLTDELHVMLDENTENYKEIAVLKSQRDRYRAALEWIDDNYANQDMDHIDFRVEAAKRARAALQGD